jgi:hypothetical protein
LDAIVFFEELWWLAALVSLNFSHNVISSIPADISMLQKFDYCKIESQSFKNNPSTALFHDPIAEVIFTQQLHRLFAGSNISAHRIVDTNLRGKFHHEITIPLRIPSNAERI